MLLLLSYAAGRLGTSSPSARPVFKPLSTCRLGLLLEFRVPQFWGKRLRDENFELSRVLPDVVQQKSWFSVFSAAFALPLP